MGFKQPGHLIQIESDGKVVKVWTRTMRLNQHFLRSPQGSNQRKRMKVRARMSRHNTRLRLKHRQRNREYQQLLQSLRAYDSAEATPALTLVAAPPSPSLEEQQAVSLQPEQPPTQQQPARFNPFAKKR